MVPAGGRRWKALEGDKVTEETQPLIQALARVHGSLTEIGTVWRRVAPDRPGLPLARPLRLADAVHDVMAAVGTLGTLGTLGTDPASLPARLASLERDLAAAAALTDVPGAPAAGDAGLWEYARVALGQAQELAASLTRLPLAS
ncbi:MAG TPA: hypothetical protein VIZ20_03295 [Streptosporangiaceae bacterium]